MTEHTRHFIDLGRTYIEAHREPGCLCAFAGGSAGRGDADECSDLDLNIYVEPPRESSSENVVFRNKILQVHVHAFPTQDQVEADPWGHRFLMESRVIWDPDFGEMVDASSLGSHGNLMSMTRPALKRLVRDEGLEVEMRSGGSNKSDYVGDIIAARQQLKADLQYADQLGDDILRLPPRGPQGPLGSLRRRATIRSCPHRSWRLSSRFLQRSLGLARNILVRLGILFFV